MTEAGIEAVSSLDEFRLIPRHWFDSSNDKSDCNSERTLCKTVSATMARITACETLYTRTGMRWLTVSSQLGRLSRRYGTLINELLRLRSYI
jgi:hypothetical protein